MSDRAAFTCYVATDGDDSWSGALPAPNAARTDGPFATLLRARAAVRAQRATPEGAGDPATVLVRGGKYYLRETLVLGPQDSGAREAPVVWRAYPGETPVLSGGYVVSGWRPWRGAILCAELPGSKGGKWPTRQLFYRGQRQTRARWPKADPTNPLYGGWALIEGPADDPLTSFRYKPGAFRRHWAKPTEVEVRYWANVGGWGSVVPIKDIDEATRTIHLQHGGWQFDVPGWYMPVTFTPDNRYYIENALEELDRPGEWCSDSEEGRLYFWPPDGALAGKVVVPRLDCLIDLRGAAWVTLSGLTLTETTDGDNQHHEGVEGAGAMYPRPGWRFCGDAIHLKDAEHCVIEECHLDQVGGNGIYLEGHTYRNALRRNDLDRCGANGIALLGSRLKHPLINEVCDNHIHDCGVLNKYTAGVFSGMSDGNHIHHNRIERLPHHAINLSNSPNGRNIVEYNEIRWVDQEVADSTAINCWMEEPPVRDAQRCGHIIRYNLIADVYGCQVFEGVVGRKGWFPTSGIYLDNYTSNCVVVGNILIRCGHAGILVHAGKNNLIEHNTIVDCLASIRLQDYCSSLDFWKPMAGFMTCNHILHNISYQRNTPANLFSLYIWTERAVARSDENVFWQVGAGDYALEHVGPVPDEAGRVTTLAAWRALDYEQHSLIADPRFVDPQRDDYRLRPDSPALALGFHETDVSKIGIRPR